MPSFNFKTKNLIVESISVCFGVLIALLANEWRESERTQQQAQVAVDAVTREVSRNRDLLTAKRDYYRNLSGSLESLSKEGQGQALVFEEVKVPGWQGFSPPLFLDAAHKTAMASPAWSTVDFAQAEAFAAAYGMQNFIMMGIDKYLDVFLRQEEIEVNQLRSIFVDLSTLAEETLKTQSIALGGES